MRVCDLVRVSFPDISRRYVEQWLRKQPEAQLDARRERAVFRPTVADRPGFVNVDLTFMQTGDWPPGANNGHTGIVVARDYFTKFLWAVPIKRKTSAEVSRAFRQMWVNRSWIPHTIRSDAGREFG